MFSRLLKAFNCYQINCLDFTEIQYFDTVFACVRRPKTYELLELLFLLNITPHTLVAFLGVIKSIIGN